MTEKENSERIRTLESVNEHLKSLYDDRSAELAQLRAKVAEQAGEIERLKGIWRCFHCGFETADQAEAAASKNNRPLRYFAKFCDEHPEHRFWQALRNWSGARFIFARTEGDAFDGNLLDTFNWEDGPYSAEPKL